MIRVMIAVVVMIGYPILATLADEALGIKARLEGVPRINHIVHELIHALRGAILCALILW
jgi:hypothetical protein